MTEVKIDVKINGKRTVKTVLLPENWNEVPEDVFPHLAHLFLIEESEMSAADKQVRVFTLLAGKAWTALQFLTEDELYDLLPLVNWVFDTLDLTKNILFKIRFLGQDGTTNLYGPEDTLNNLRFAEFCYADTFFIQYNKTQNLLFLDKLVGTMYRQVGKGPEYRPGSLLYRGDLREKFNSNNLDAYCRYTISKIPLLTKKAIYLFYLSARWHLTLDYPHVFPQPKPGDKPKKRKPDEPDFGWIGVMDDLGGEKGRSSADLEEEFLSTILLSLERGQIKWKKYKEAV